MVHDVNSCSRCKPLVEMLRKNTFTAEELEQLGASRREEWDGSDKGRHVDGTEGYVLSPLVICPHYKDPKAINFERNPDGMYKKV